MGVMKPTAYSVDAEGSFVTLVIGGQSFTMEYNTAFDIAQRMRIMGRQAKANAGDKSKSLRALGLLTDAEADEKRTQSMRDSTAVFNGG